MADLVLSAPAMPSANAGVAGIAANGNANGTNSATFKFSNGSVALDDIPNAALLAALPASSRLRALFNATYATVDAMNEAFAAAGMDIGYPPGAAVSPDLTFTNAAPGKPTATVTTTAASGVAFRISVAHSFTR